MRARVNSKATLRLTAKDFLPLIPHLLHSEVLASRYFASKSESLVIQGDESRSQAENIKECYGKLHAMVVAAGRKAVKGETSQTQVERVKAL